MNFLNSYISIFKRKINDKIYVKSMLLILILTYLGSFILNQMDFLISDNDVIRNYQLEKINSSNLLNVNTIIIGDSSGGNAIDSKLFSKLSGLNTQNLCLTGSWGLVGSLGILKKSIEKNENIKNVIIIHTLDIWKREFSKESILELFTLSDILENKYVNNNTIFGYLFNPKEIFWHVKFIVRTFLGFEANDLIDYENDYTKQGNIKYSNGKKQIKQNYSFNNLRISESKIIELNYLQDYCISKNLNCMFVHGLIHEEVLTNSKNYVEYLNNNLEKLIKINFSKNIFSYPNNKMGNSNDHIDIEFKKESTLDYFNLIKKNLIVIEEN